MMQSMFSIGPGLKQDTEAFLMSLSAVVDQSPTIESDPDDALTLVNPAHPTQISNSKNPPLTDQFWDGSKETLAAFIKALPSLTPPCRGSDPLLPCSHHRLLAVRQPHPQ